MYCSAILKNKTLNYFWPTFSFYTPWKHTAQKWSFLLCISSVNVTKSAGFLWIWSHLLKKSLIKNFIFLCSNTIKYWFSNFFRGYEMGTLAKNGTAQKIKFSIKDFFSKCDHIRSYLRIWSHLLKKSLMENFIFCAVWFKVYQQP